MSREKLFAPPAASWWGEEGRFFSYRTMTREGNGEVGKRRVVLACDRGLISRQVAMDLNVTMPAVEK